MLDNLKAPYFIIDEVALTKNINDFHQALERNWGNSIIGYSFKTNSLPWVLKHMKKNNCYAEVVSSAEYKLALHMGYDKDKIIFNGPVKGKQEFITAIENQSIVNIDSKRELDWIKEMSEKDNLKIKVGIRVNFDLERLVSKEVDYEGEGSRFGFSLENGDFYRVVETLESLPNVEIIGIHLHYTSRTRSLDVYKELAKKACEIKIKTAINFEFIDIGGGFFGGLPDKPSFDEYVKVIAKELTKEFNPADTALIVEPGSAIIGSPVSFVTEVIDAKDTFTSRIVTLNGSRINVDPLWMKNNYFYDIVTNSKQTAKKQIVCGFTCMDTDRIMNIYNGKELLIGDRVIFNNIGAYTMSLNPLFIEYFPPVYVYDGEKYECVREQWDVSEYVQKSHY